MGHWNASKRRGGGGHAAPTLYHLVSGSQIADDTARLVYSGPVVASDWADAAAFADTTTGGAGTTITNVSPTQIDVTFDTGGMGGFDNITQDGGPSYVLSPDSVNLS